MFWTHSRFKGAVRLRGCGDIVDFESDAVPDEVEGEAASAAL
jgi:hypothetical protein